MSAQSLEALERANHVRLRRAAIRREIADGQRAVADVLADVPPEMATMSVLNLLCAQHRWGGSRAQRVLRATGIAGHRPVGALTDRQRDALIARLQGWA